MARRPQRTWLSSTSCRGEGAVGDRPLSIRTLAASRTEQVALDSADRKPHDPVAFALTAIRRAPSNARPSRQRPGHRRARSRSCPHKAPTAAARRPAPLRSAERPAWRGNRQCTNIQTGSVGGGPVTRCARILEGLPFARIREEERRCPNCLQRLQSSGTDGTATARRSVCSSRRKRPQCAARWSAWRPNTKDLSRAQCASRPICSIDGWRS